MTPYLSRETLKLSDLALTLLVTWVCGLFWGVGIFLSALAFIGTVVTGLLNFFSPPTWGGQSLVILALGSAAVFAAPILFGAFLAHNWRKGFINGLAALLTSATGFFLFYWIAGFMYELFSSKENVFFSLLTALPAALAVATAILLNEYPRNVLGLALGSAIGLCLSLAGAVLLGPNLFADNNIFHLLWQIPGLVWVSTVYWSELSANRRAWVAFPIWVLLVLINFGVPFVMVPLIPLK